MTNGRAGVPPGWQVAGKTGTGDYGAANHVAILPVLAVLSASGEHDAKPDNALFVEVARTITTALAPPGGGG